MKASVWTSMARSMSVLALAAPTVLAAQNSAECKINDSSPYQINGAKQYVNQAANAKVPSDAPKYLKNAVKVLTDAPEKINNETGRQYLLLKAYAAWLQRDGASYVMKRGDVGFTANPNGEHNLLLAIDSTSRAVESALPGCSATVAPYRLKFFGEIMNKAVEALNAESSDSAVYYARLSQQVSSTDPRPWNVLMAVYTKKGQQDSAMLAMEKVIALAGTDTAYKRVKQQSRYNLAVLTLQQAETAQGDDKTQKTAKARGLLEDFLKDQPGDASATQALGRVLRLAGDTAAVTEIFGDILKDPSKYNETQLFEAASNAALARQDADAVKLFEAGLAKNPYHRVALLNFANVLFGMKDTERMGPAVQRLVSLDPNYGNAWRLMGGYWQLRARGETDAAKKKVYNDSTLYYLDRESKLNPRVDVTLAAKNGNAFEVQGQLTNESQAAGTYTIKLELLDAAGAVVATKDIAVGPVAPGSAASFSTKVDAPKAVGYRYAPIK